MKMSRVLLKDLLRGTSLNPINSFLVIQVSFEFRAARQLRDVSYGLGDLVLIHGSVLHKSERNTSDKTRFAYTFHMIESPPIAHYDEKNWLQPTPEMPFSQLDI